MTSKAKKNAKMVSDSDESSEQEDQLIIGDNDFGGDGFAEREFDNQKQEQ